RDWSSDVCSSDLCVCWRAVRAPSPERPDRVGGRPRSSTEDPQTPPASATASFTSFRFRFEFAIRVLEIFERRVRFFGSGKQKPADLAGPSGPDKVGDTAKRKAPPLAEEQAARRNRAGSLYQMSGCFLRTQQRVFNTLCAIVCFGPVGSRPHGR